VKVLAVLLVIVALVIIIVPQFTNCEYGKDRAATETITITTVGSSIGGAQAAAGLPYRMMKCFWSARAEIIAGIPLLAVGALLLFARRKETTRVLGIVAIVTGVLTILIPTTIVGTCANSMMVCNTEMKPTLLVAGGLTIALGIAAIVVGEMRRESGGSGVAAA
jgi:peptidoglycan/LPS O-acetylase OafA/YrhL